MRINNLSKAVVSCLRGATLLCTTLAISSLVHAESPSPLSPGTQQHCGEFSELRMVLEQNATDADTEVVLFAKGQDDGLQRLEIIAPTGRLVTTFAGARQGIGIREFLLESAEPEDLQAVLRSFPQGYYRFRGITVNQDCLQGKAYLSHTLAPTTTLLAPTENETVPIGQVLLQWSAVLGAERYIVELKDRDHGNEYVFEVNATTTSLNIPATLLQPNTTYQFAVAVQVATGNLSSVELEFFTIP